MGQLDQRGIVTLQEPMVTTLATADVVAKLLSDKGLATKKEFETKLLVERATYQALLRRVGKATVDA
jgi:hypothetical protein